MPECISQETAIIVVHDKQDPPADTLGIRSLIHDRPIAAEPGKYAVYYKEFAAHLLAFRDPVSLTADAKDDLTRRCCWIADCAFMLLGVRATDTLRQTNVTAIAKKVVEHANGSISSKDPHTVKIFNGLGLSGEQDMIDFIIQNKGTVEKIFSNPAAYRSTATTLCIAAAVRSNACRVDGIDITFCIAHEINRMDMLELCQKMAGGSTFITCSAGSGVVDVPTLNRIPIHTRRFCATLTKAHCPHLKGKEPTKRKKGKARRGRDSTREGSAHEGSTREGSTSGSTLGQMLLIAGVPVVSFRKIQPVRVRRLRAAREAARQLAKDGEGDVCRSDDETSSEEAEYTDGEEDNREETEIGDPASYQEANVDTEDDSHEDGFVDVGRDDLF